MDLLESFWLEMIWTRAAFSTFVLTVAQVDAFGSGKLPSLLLSSLHPVSRTGYGGQVQLLVSGLSKDFHVQLLAWNLKHRGEGPAEDLKALLQGKGINGTEALAHAGGDPRALLPGVPVVTSQLAPPTGHEKGQGWFEILRAVDLFSVCWLKFPTGWHRGHSKTTLNWGPN